MSRASKQKVLFICGSLNQTTQMHQIASELGECEAHYTPYYVSGFLELARRLGLLEMTIAGDKLRARCLRYLDEHQLPIDVGGNARAYDLVVTCSDLVIPRNLRGTPIVLVQEGILDPITPMFPVVKRIKLVPPWVAGTAATGQSLAYQRFCVASEGYRKYFVEHGVPEDHIDVTGIPNFDNCRSYLDNHFPHRGYVLVCTSDARETFKRDDRASFLRDAVAKARGRELIVKLHPNEDESRARREIAEVAPQALVFASGSAEEMVANADVVICQYSTLAFVAVALGKEVHSYFPNDQLRSLLPIQNGCAAEHIAGVCREFLSDSKKAIQLSVVDAGHFEPRHTIESRNAGGIR